MSHRIIIYNIATPSESNESDKIILEWSYEIPLILQPLLSGNGFVAENIYNNYTKPDNFGLYFDASSGIQNFKRFFNFLEKHNTEFIEDFSQFSLAKEKLFQYLDRLKEQYFHVDAWDVFSMTIDDHFDQATQLLEDINQNNNAIQAAIEADDPSLLDLNFFTRNSVIGFESFKELVNFPDYDFGWKHIWQNNDFQDVEVFQDNELWGLKNAKGEILINPFFDEIFAFDETTNLAVAVKNEKFGFINKDGKIIIPLIYDDAYDFKNGCAIVRKDGKESLMDETGNIKFDFIYDELIELEHFYSAKIRDKFGIIDNNGSTKIPVESGFAFEENTWKKIYFTKENGKGHKCVYSSKFNFLGNFNPDYLEAYCDAESQEIVYSFSKHKYQNISILISDKGKIILEDFDKIIASTSNELLIRKNKKYGIYKLDKGFILDFEYDLIENFSHHFDITLDKIFENFSEDSIYNSCSFFKAKKENLYGIYISVGQFETWVIPISFKEIKPLKSEYFAVKTQNKWAVFKIGTGFLTKFIFDEIFNLISYSGIAYGMVSEQVFTITENEICLADKIIFNNILTQILSLIFIILINPFR